MFSPLTEVKYKDKVYPALAGLVESYRDSRGKVRQGIVWKVGRLDELLEEGKLKEIIEKLRKFCKERFVVPGEIGNQEMSNSASGKTPSGTLPVQNGVDISRKYAIMRCQE